MSVRNEFEDFMRRRAQDTSREGIAPDFLPDYLFDFQRALVEWATLKGRAAIFADCGLGKTPMQLVYAQNVVRATNRPFLILTPLAVGAQMAREAGEKFGIDVHRCMDGKPRPGINVTNYEKLHKFDPNDFAGVACDESSILKSFDGTIRGNVTVFLRKMRFRLLCTATAAPNDYTELGTSSEALGHLGHMDMLNRFFKNDANLGAKVGRAYGQVVKWRFKGHAETPFWRWVCSWARALRRPTDLGFDDRRFVLPDLVEREHVVTARRLRDGHLFAMPAMGLAEEREERRRTIMERCEMAAHLATHGNPVLVWCHLNDEANALERLIPGAVQVSGADSDEEKEEKLLGFAEGRIRALVTKPVLGAWGLNFQHCAHVVTFPSHSFEQYYQSIRRCWRFGQTREVVVDVVTTDGESGVVENLKRKQAQAETMFIRLVGLMGQHMNIERDKRYANRVEVPSWL